MFNDKVFISDFGEPIVIGGQSYLGIFDRKQIQVSDGFTMSSTVSNELVMFSNDVHSSGAKQKTVINIKGVEFEVYDSFDDGLGVCTLYLHEVRE